MFEAFRAPRRKWGLVVLVLACLLLAVWLRSFHYMDSVSIPSATLMRSLYGEIRWLEKSVEPGTLDPYDFEFDTARLIPNERFPAIEDGESAVHWQFLGFGTTYVQFPLGYDERSAGTMAFRVWRLKYMMLIVPLSLFSAWLLLRTPRKPTSDVISGPASS